MTDISAALVKELREATNVGMMECKRALVEARGNKTKAIQILRERGIAVAEKRAGRAANQGVIAASITGGGRAGSLVEVNCETDFVAKNETFRTFSQRLAEKAAATDDDLAVAARGEIVERISEIGENIVARRNIRFVLRGAGVIASYIHHGSTIGVLAEIGCGKAETASNPLFAELSKDICLHIAASSPRYTDQESVPPETVAAEREIYAKQVQNKPPQIVQKIVDGKMKKFYEQVCLVCQPFVKDQEKSVGLLLKEKGAQLQDDVVVRRFARFQVGETL